MKSILIVLSMAFISTFAMANEGRIINIFYTYTGGGSLATNLEHPSDRDGFLRTKKILMTSKEIEQCYSVCEAEIVGDNYNAFSIKVAGEIVARVTVSDSDSLLPRRSFTLVSISSKLGLFLDLDDLKNPDYSDLKTEVVIQK